MRLGVGLLLTVGLTGCGSDDPSADPSPSATANETTGETETTAPETEEASPAAASDDPIQIAVMADRSDALAFFGQRAQEGWDVALEAIDAQIAGRTVEYINVQCSEPAACGGDTARVIREDGADLIMGTPGSALALAISQAAADNEVVYFETASLASALLPEGTSDYIFRGAPSTEILNEGVTLAIERWYEQIGQEVQGATAMLVNEGSAANQDSADVQQELLGGLGIEIVDQIEYQADGDFRPIAQRIADTDADILVETSYVGDGIALNTELAQLNYVPDLHVIAGAPAPADQLEALGAEYLENIVHVTYPAMDVQTDAMDEFRTVFDEVHGGEPDSPYPITYYSSARILFDILEATGGDATPATFKDAASQMDVPVGSYANGWGAAFDDRGQNQRAVSNVIQWQGGEVCTVLPADVAACELQTNG